MDGMPHTVKPDIDNLTKGLLDAVLKEDSHIWSVRTEKRWSLTPGIEIVKESKP
jgi:Holliday junction resolvase RusA-like endonuclease